MVIDDFSQDIKTKTIFQSIYLIFYYLLNLRFQFETYTQPRNDPLQSHHYFKESELTDEIDKNYDYNLSFPSS